MIYASCRKRGFDSTDSEDISQTVLVRVHKGMSGFQRDGVGKRFRFWIAGILRNEIAEFCRQRAKRPIASGGRDSQVVLSAIPAPDEDSHDDLFSPAKLMSRTLQLIRQDFRESTWRAFELVEIEKLSHSEAGEKLGMSANTVRQANFRIRKRIREEIEGFLS